MLKSLIDNNPRVVKDNLPFVIISNDLNPEDLITSRKIYDNIHIKRFDSEIVSFIEDFDSIDGYLLKFGRFCSNIVT